MAEELKKEQDGSSMLERMKRNMECTVKGTEQLMWVTGNPDAASDS